MLNSPYIALIVSSVLGFLAGVGVGGGSLLMLWLTLICTLPYENARILNLLFFIPSAVIASIFRLRQGSLTLKKVLPAMIAGSVAAGIFSWISKGIDTTYIEKGFGILLLITGLRELFYNPKEKK